MQNNKIVGSPVFPKRHLFLDIDNVVEWDYSLEQRFHQAEKVVVTGLECGPAGSWDARCTVAWGSTHVENGLFRKWYNSMREPSGYGENIDVWQNSYAESEDGIHWRKPDLKITGQNRWPGNNLIPLPGCVMSVVRPLPDADCKYLALTIQHTPLEQDICDAGGFEYNGSGVYLFKSDDGLRWRQFTRHPIIAHGDVCYLHVDPLKKRYLIYQKVGCNQGLNSRRSFLVMESENGLDWTGYDGVRRWQEAFVADDYDDLLAVQQGYRIAEYYSFTFHQVDSLYLSVQNLINVGLPLKNQMGQNPNGTSYFRMAFSHDGKSWRHPRNRPPFLQVGEPGDFDAGFLAGTSNLVEHGDEQLLYYSGSRYYHGCFIDVNFRMKKDIPLEAQRGYNESRGLAKIKRDRFAGLTATWKSCFDVEVGPRQGDELTINVASLRGVVRVAIAEQSAPFHLELRKSDSLPGFSFDDCIPITADAIKVPVRFKNTGIANIDKNKFLILRFEVTTAEVFGYEWL